MIGERLKVLRIKNHLKTKVEAAKLFGLPYTTYVNYEKGDREPRSEELIMFASKYNVSVDYILGRTDDASPPTTGEKAEVEDISPAAHRIARAYDIAPEPTQRIVEVVLEPYMDKTPPPRLKLSEPDTEIAKALSCIDTHDPESYRSLPLHLLPAAAGTGALLDSDDFDLVDVGPEVSVAANFGVRISGDSMEPVYPNGCIAWAKRTVTIENGQIGVFVLDNTGYIKKWMDGRLISLNKKYAPMDWNDFEDARVCGVVVDVTEDVYK